MAAKVTSELKQDTGNTADKPSQNACPLQQNAIVSAVKLLTNMTVVHWFKINFKTHLLNSKWFSDVHFIKAYTV